MTSSADDLTRVLFARGWLLTREAHPAAAPAHWNHRSLPDGWHLAADTSVPIGVTTDGSAQWVALVGHVVDLCTGDADLHTVSTMLRSALATSRTEFLDRLDALAGRYVVIHHDGHHTRVLSDATGMRSVYVAPGTAALSSHARLLSDHTGLDEPSALSLPDARELLKYGWPGRSTAWNGVYLLTPNTEVEALTGEVRRFHPRHEAVPMSVEEAATLTMSDLQRHATATLQQSTVCASLTAGQDSRVTLAALAAERDRVTFFTYTAGPAHRIDVAVAREIARRLALHHEVLEVRPAATDDDERFRLVLLEHSQYAHQPRLADAYRQHAARLGPMHVRSNLGEIGRLFYQPNFDRPRPCDPESLSVAYARGRTELATHPAVVAAFADYASASDLRDGHGLDPYDLLYWEHRMGAWHAAVVAESDPAFDTTVLWNSRRTLGRWLGVDRDSRRDGAVFGHILRDHLPELADLPINPRMAPARPSPDDANTMVRE